MTDTVPPHAFPRVLIVSAEPIGTGAGTGVTLSNLFNGWPTAHLAQLYTTGPEPEAGVCATHLRLPDSSAPIDHFVRRMLGGSTKALASAAPTTAAVPSTGALGGRRAARARVHREMRAVADLSLVRLPAGTAPWLRDFSPQVVYSLLGNVRLMRLAARVAQMCGRSLVPHFMDDWPSTLYTSGEMFGQARRTVSSSLAQVIDRADRGMCISAPMADEYQRRYGIPFTDFANCVDEDGFRDPATRDSGLPCGELRAVYVGGLHLGRWESLLHIADVLASADLTDVRATLTVHAPAGDLAKHGRALSAHPAVRLGRSLGQAEVADALQAADILVHVESFDEAFARYARLSLSTKIPQYMAAGRPILGYGPPHLASMLHIQSAGAGVLVGRRDPETLSSQVRRLCHDSALREVLGANGYRYARQHHHRAAVSARFAQLLRDVTI
ncbi:glycosyltransferase family 4 protein [Krasilnikovia sp. M28-CT-15]|uniref:glycosyltransferase family 4 protein n=1 Tax=Krasilnikovia sp. M28-CT-15 TaxID=3373540 RepID=UPI0038764B73